MKKNLHPATHEVTAHCACGYSFVTSSTKDDISTSICSHCHPFYTGAQKFLDTAGRIEKFEQRYKKFQDGNKKTAEAAKPTEVPAKKKAPAAKATKAKTK